MARVAAFGRRGPNIAGQGRTAAAAVSVEFRFANGGYTTRQAMHTAVAIAGGFALMAICLLGGRLTGTLAKATLAFIPLWLVGAGIRTWVGVAKASYTAQHELPIFLVIFAVSAAVALGQWWKL